MPFYLVIQTTLIEADDEQAAAQNAIDEIRSGAPVTVSVKYDETTISHVTVGRKEQVPRLGPAATTEDAKPQSVSRTSIAPETSKKDLLSRIITDVRSLITGRL